MRNWVVVLAALAACGNSSGKPSNKIMLMPDAPVDSAPPTQVTLVVLNTPQYIAYRDGSGPWQTPPSDGQGDYTLDVHDDYQWVIVCAGGGQFDAILQGATVADGGQQFAFCFAGGGSGSTVDVTGTMTQAGTVALGGATQTSATASWGFDLAVAPGTHDVVAYDTDTILVKRSQAISAATSLGTLDVAADGTAMTPITLTVGNLGTDTLTTELDWFLTNDAVFFTGATTMLETPPASVMVQQDFEFLEVDASSPSTLRFADTEFTGAQTSFTLLDPLTGITFGAANNTVSATWGALPSYTSLSLFVVSATGTQETSVSQSWVAATGATQLAWDVTPPSYDPSWQVDLTGPYERELELGSSSGLTNLGTSVFDEVNGPLVRAAHSRAALRRAREARRRSAAR